MTATLHWLRNSSLLPWLQQHSHLLGDDDALLLSGEALKELSVTKHSIQQPIFAREREVEILNTTVPDYVMLKSDSEWVELVLSFPQQITW
ncbi:hypothetical protein [Idiomarina sp. HP20-50]|uniref:hypothetical protein n=1 Tax=Idiomarina sp. HP20-50 TaxID=3070813 RepID=UPI00294AE650|nr:hypothetical protein [Idiomarina sp. HP20-50]MDV6315172.1 hypothetical protein [Idiomarina sp. HP20-50]